MTGLKIAIGTAITSGALIPVVDKLDPQGLKGLNAEALLTAVALAALVFAAYFVKSFASAMGGQVKAINEQTVSQTINNERIGDLCNKIESQPCLAKISETAKAEALGLVAEAKRHALNLVDDARKEALRLLEETRRNA